VHQTVYREFERICAAKDVGSSVLEVGALPSEDSLLAMKCLSQVPKKIGLNIVGPFLYKGIQIVQGNANAMTCFADGAFDTVLCNAMLEHDKYFWKTTAEIKRVTRPGGLVIIGVPGYIEYPMEKRVQRLLARIPGLRNHVDWLTDSTITFRIHNQPGDYYRFSPQAVKEVFFENMSQIEIHSIMVPPRIIACGIKDRTQPRDFNAELHV
jgi:SAM-dependent methyltransferase